MLARFAPTGVYVIPYAPNPRRWFGTLFINQGYYSDGIFKFCIDFPIEYPDKMPDFTFMTKIFHPLIDQSCGRVDLSLGFPLWQSGKHNMLAVLFYVKKIFLIKRYFEVDISFNKEAALLFKSEKYYQFAKRVRKYIREASEKIYQFHPQSPLKFNAQEPLHLSIKQNLLGRTQIDEREQIKGFKVWFFNTFLRRLRELGQTQQQS